MEKIKFEEEWNELCPIYLENDNNFFQIGTGVLIDIFDSIYLLTAAHIIDEYYKSHLGHLLIPSENSFIPISGIINHKHLKNNETREDDKIDFSFFKLDDKTIRALHSIFKPLKPHQIRFNYDYTSNMTDIIKKEILTYRHPKNSSKELKNIHLIDDKENIISMNNYLIKNMIIFAGYPNTKSKTHQNIHTSEIVYYWGGSVHKKTYEQYNCNTQIQILSEFGKHKALDSNFDLRIPPKPFGISGGGIYKIIRKNNSFDRELIGIAHTYKKK